MRRKAASYLCLVMLLLVGGFGSLPPVSAQASSLGVAPDSFYQSACPTPRPAVGVAVNPQGDGVIKVTLTAGNGTIQLVKFGTMVNAHVSVPGTGQTVTSGQEVKPPPGSTTWTFDVVVEAAVQAGPAPTTTIPMTIFDGCGTAQPWQTFVGGGVNSLQSTANISDTQVSEGNTGNTQVSFTVKLTVPSSQTISYAFNTASGSALSPSDFVAATGTVTFNPGETTKTVVVQARGDYDDESDETFTITLSNPVNGRLGRSTATARIINDDTGPSASGDTYVATIGQQLTVAAPGVLSNDQPGTQAVSVVKFGGLDAGGTVDDNAAGATKSLGAGGSLTVRADGSFDFTPPTGAGSTFSFQYRAESLSGQSVASVIVNVQTGPAANDDPNYVATGSTQLSVNAGTGVLANDTRGTPQANVTLFGTTTPNTTVGTPLDLGNGGSLTVQGDGSFTFTSPSTVTGPFTFKYRIQNPAGTSDATVTVTVARGPVITTTAPSTPFSEGNSPVLIDAALTVTNPSGGNIDSATVVIANPQDGANEVLALTAPPAGITANYVAATHTLNLTGARPATDYQTALRNVTFDDTSQGPNTTARTIQFQAIAGVQTGNQATKTVTVASVDDAPALSGLEPGPLPYAENDPPTFVTGSLAVQDIDNPTLAGATVGITTGCVAAEDVLALNPNPQNGISAVYTPATCTLVLSGSSSVTNYELALRAIQYSNSSNSPTTAARTLAFQVTDGTTGSNTVSRGITVGASNDLPVVTTTGGSTLFTEGGGAVPVDTGVTVTDPDSANLASATVTISNLLDGTSEALAASVTFPGITASYASGTGILTLTGSDTVAHYQQVFASVTYNNTSGAPTTTSRTITYVANDGTGNSNSATKTVTLNSVNSAPVVTTSVGTTPFTEHTSPIPVDVNLTVVDSDNLTLASATVTITNIQDAGVETLSAFTGGTLITPTYAPATGVLTLSGTDTVTNYQLVLRSVSYEDSAGTVTTTPDRVIRFQVNDGTVNSNLADRTVTVSTVNDAPSGADKIVTTTEDVAYTFTVADFGFTDPLDTPPNALLAVKITTLPAAGTLQNNGTPVLAGAFVPVADISGGLLKFVPATGASGTPYATFAFQVQDNGGTAGGGLDLDPTQNTVTINVTAVNSPPAGTDGSVSTLEDTAYIFGAADFGFTDPLDTPANALLAVTIASTPSAGTLTNNGVPVTASQSIPVADINGGLLAFTPAANGSGLVYATFTFQVQDNGGGTDLDLSPNTITIVVTPVNDAPAGTDNTVTTLEDTAHTFTAADFGFTDPLDTPANALQAVGILSTPAAGSLTLNNVAVSAPQVVSLANINGGLLKFTPAPNANGLAYASFTFAVQDNGGTASGGVDTDQSANTITINVTPVIDDPTAVNDPQTVLEDSGLSTFSVLGNDTNPDGATMTIAGVSVPTSGQASAAVAAGSTQVTYTPNANYCNTQIGGTLDTFTYTISPGGSIGTVTVTVTCVNDTPSFTITTPTNTTTEDAGPISVASFATLINDGDPESTQTLTFTLTPTGSPTVTFQTAPAISDTGTLTYRAAADSNGTATFDVTLADNGVPVGTSAAQSITITVTPVNDPPLVTPPGAYSVLTNTQRTIADGTSDLIQGATIVDPDGTAFTVTAGTISSAQAPGANNVVLNANGSFSYDPPAGFTGTDTFQYEVCDNGSPTPAECVNVTASVSVSGTAIWYINNDGAACAANCDGRLSHPFKTLAAFQAVNDNVGNHPGNSDVIFLYQSATAYDGPVTLLTGQKVVGQDASSELTAISGVSPPPGSLALPLMDPGNAATTLTSTGTTVTLGSGNTLRGFTLGSATTSALVGTTIGTLTLADGSTDDADVTINTNGQAMSLATGTVNGVLAGTSSSGGATNVTLTSIATTGTFNLGTGAFSGATGRSIDIDTGTGSITYAGTISNTAAGIRVANKTGGTVLLSGTTKTLSTGANAAVTLASNTGATINFTGGGLDVDTTTGTGFNATGGGTVTVQGAGNTITSISATALNVANTIIGAADLTFVSIASGNNTAAGDPVNGIVLNNTGSSGGLTVTGDGVNATQGGNGSGGTIQNTTGVGVSLTSTQDVNLNYMNITEPGTHGIQIQTINGFTLNRSTISDGNGVAQQWAIAVGDFSTGTPVNGTINVTNSIIGPAAGNAPHNLISAGISSGTSTWNITGSNLRNNGNAAVNVETRNTAVVTNMTISGNTFPANNINSAEGIHIQPAAGTSSLTATINNNQFANQNIAIDVNSDTSADMTYTITNNTIINDWRNDPAPAAGSDTSSHAINVFMATTSTSAASLFARIEDNTIGDGDEDGAGPDTGIPGSGSSIGSGMRINFNGNGQGRVLLDNNTIRETPVGRGIEIIGRNGTGQLDVTVTNNNIRHYNLGFDTTNGSNFPLGAIVIQSNTVTTAGYTVRADVRGNTVPAASGPLPAASEVTGQYLTLEELPPAGGSNLQLVDSTAPISGTCTSELTGTNTGNAGANAGCSLISGPINTPP